MLIAMPWSWSSPVKAVLGQTWAPWSVLKIAGRPWRASASATASQQKVLSRVIETRQLSTRRLAQSITAARKTKPRAMGIYVISIAHTWLGRVIGR